MVQQAVEDALHVCLARTLLPEVLVIILHPKGNLETAGEVTLRSNQGFSSLHVSWRLVELWKVPADALFEAGDVGLIPRVALAQFEGPPESVMPQCRTRIDRDAPPKERESLLAVAQVLARLRYNDKRLFQTLGGRKAMIESPVLREIIGESRRVDIGKIL